MRDTLGVRGQLTGFSLLFAAGMWMSKIAQPLHFENANALFAFGVGYAVMAVVGGFSFAWGALADRLGGLGAMRIGAIAYAAGIAGRLFTDVGPSIAFSILAGAGASLVLVGIRPWILSRAMPDEIPRIVSSRNLGSQVGMLAGTLGAGGLFMLASQGDGGTRVALIVAPCLVVAGVLWLATAGGSVPGSTSSEKAKPTSDRGSFRLVAIKLGVIGLLSGFSVSLIAPYLPLFFTESGALPSEAAIVIALMSCAQVVMTWSLNRRGTSERPYALFLVAELAAGSFTLLAGLMMNAGVLALAVLLVLRAAFVALAIVAEETIQYAVIPTRAAGFVFGISQTAFLAGDALGGAIGAPIWTGLGPAGLAFIAGGGGILNAFLLPALLRDRRRRSSAASVS